MKALLLKTAYFYAHLFCRLVSLSLNESLGDFELVLILTKHFNFQSGCLIIAGKLLANFYILALYLSFIIDRNDYNFP